MENEEMDNEEMENEEIEIIEWPKFLSTDFKTVDKVNDDYYQCTIRSLSKINEFNKTFKFRTVYVQGFIEQKPCDDVMILRDAKGRIKITNCADAIKYHQIEIIKGTYCSVMGTLERHTGLPEISVQKITKLEHPDLEKDLFYNNWPIEVLDYKFSLMGFFPCE